MDPVGVQVEWCCGATWGGAVRRPNHYFCSNQRRPKILQPYVTTFKIINKLQSWPKLTNYFPSRKNPSNHFTSKNTLKISKVETSNFKITTLKISDPEVIWDLAGTQQGLVWCLRIEEHFAELDIHTPYLLWSQCECVKPMEPRPSSFSWLADSLWSFSCGFIENNNEQVNWIIMDGNHQCCKFSASLKYHNIQKFCLKNLDKSTLGIIRKNYFATRNCKLCSLEICIMLKISNQHYLKVTLVGHLISEVSCCAADSAIFAELASCWWTVSADQVKSQGTLDNWEGFNCQLCFCHKMLATWAESANAKCVWWTRSDGWPIISCETLIGSWNLSKQHISRYMHSFQTLHNHWVFRADILV